MTQTKSIKISGMTCQMCVRHITRALESIPGLHVQSVDVGSARVAYDPAVIPDQKILSAVQEAGYTAQITG